MTTKKRSNKHPLAARLRSPDPLVQSEAQSLVTLEAMLFSGSLVGGKSLEALLVELKEKGPFHPVRDELIQHLHRCLEAALEARTFTLARARTGKSFPKKTFSHQG